MRILKVHNFYTQPGGEDTVYHNETALLRSHGHEVIEYHEFNNNIEAMNKALVAIQTIWSYSSYRKFRKFLQASRPNVVHFHNTFPLISPSAYFACKDLEIPVIQTLDNQRLICPAASFYRDGKLCLECLGKTPPWPGILHACYHDSHLHTAVVASMLAFNRWLKTWQRKVDLFLCSTYFYKDLFVEAGLPTSKIVVMPHFVWDDPLPGPAEKNDGYAVFIGRLDAEKGVKTLLNAWLHIDFPLKIRGNGHFDKQAREFVRRHNLSNIEFVERLKEGELSELISKARFLIMPSEGYYETFGMVIIEAYSRGVPAVASNIGVIPELVSDKQTGLLFEAGNAQDLADKARWMWDHQDEADIMGKNGLAQYKQRFTPNRCYETLIDTYERLIHRI